MNARRLKSLSEAMASVVRQMNVLSAADLDALQSVNDPFVQRYVGAFKRFDRDLNAAARALVTQQETDHA